MILGIGMDLVEVERIRDAHDRFGERFLERLFLPDEIAYCLAFGEPAQHLAVRFAAKEAVSKALGTGIGSRLGWHDIEVRGAASGQPCVALHGAGAHLIEAIGGSLVHLTLTHTAAHAAAFVVIESD